MTSTVQRCGSSSAVYKAMVDRVQIRHETLRVAVIQKLEEALDIQPDGSIAPSAASPQWSSEDEDDKPNTIVETQPKIKFEPFKDLFKRRFLWYYEHYMSTIEQYSSKNKDGTDFTKMPFEGGGNTMDGKFKYIELSRRLVRIKEVIREETNNWAVEGLAMKNRESAKAATLQQQFRHLEEYLKRKKLFNANVELENDNPFVWIVTYLGKPGTHLDGGLFKVKVSISPQFPDEQPRVRVETPIYHHRVSKDGVLCYFPQESHLMRNHIESIMEALEEESPPYDPRTIVHPEATKLLWGSESDKKRYYRQLRRSAQRTTEDAET